METKQAIKVDTQELGRILPKIENRVEALKLILPEDHKPYTDKYFLRTNEILKADGLNPWVRAQVFLRGGPGEIRGIDEAIAIIDKYSNIRQNGGKVYAKEEGEIFEPLESVMIIEARVQDIIELETMYLGVIAGETRKSSLGVAELDTDKIKERMQAICLSAEGRPVYYLGARHARWDEDSIISKAAFAGGAAGASTDIGAAHGDLLGMGTIPHALENIYAWIYGKDNAVVESTKAFDRVIDKAIPRIALVDYNNREVGDSVAVARALEGKLSAVRVDTCGENVAQGAFEKIEDVPLDHPLRKILDKIPAQDVPFWFGRGVTVSGVFAIREALDHAGFDDVQIVLTSGFGKLEKDEAFRRANELLKWELGSTSIYQQWGVGKIFPSCTSTMDLTAVSDSPNDLDEHELSKVGRPARPNPSLELRLGELGKEGRA